MSILQDNPNRPYYDTPKPPRFGNAETFDSQIFAGVDEHARSLLKGDRDARYSPIEVASWLDQLAASANRHAMALESVGEADAEVRRLVADVRIQAGIGHFFASKLRCGVLWAIFQQTREPSAAREAVKAYRQARNHWANAAKIGQVYVADLSYGEEPWLRGHWRDRLPQVEADIAEMARLADDSDGSVRGDREFIWAAIGQVLAVPVRAEIPARHQSPASFKPGSVVTLVISGLSAAQLSGLLHYRHVNQAEVWKSTDLVSTSDGLVATIPADYTRSRFALQYYFELRKETAATLYPGLAPDLANQPYFVIRQGD